MNDPTLWLSFGATVILGFLLLSAIERRQGHHGGDPGRRLPGPGRGR